MFHEKIHQIAGFRTLVRQAAWRAALGLMLAAGTATAAGLSHAAQGPGKPLSMAVPYGDLDISRDEGVRTLYGRLRAAATRVCEPLKSRDLSIQQLWQACYQGALSDAIAQLGNERLAALHAARYQQRVPQRLQIARHSE